MEVQRNLRDVLVVKPLNKPRKGDSYSVALFALFASFDISISAPSRNSGGETKTETPGLEIHTVGALSKFQSLRRRIAYSHDSATSDIRSDPAANPYSPSLPSLPLVTQPTTRSNSIHSPPRLQPHKDSRPTRAHLFNMADSQHNYKFNVTMTCGGCSGAVERVLKKLDGKHSLSLAEPGLSPPLSSDDRRRQILRRLPGHPDRKHRDRRQSAL